MSGTRSGNPALEHLLRGVSRRMRLERFLAGFGPIIAVAGALALLAIIAMRTALLPERLPFWALGTVPALAALGALAWARRPSRSLVARTIDRRAGTKDLFLTACLGPAGGFAPVVLAQAQERAVGLKPAVIQALRLRAATRWFAGTLALLCAAYLWFPRLDPFALGAKREEVFKKRQDLERLRDGCEKRKAEIARQEPTAPNSKSVAAELQELMRALRAFDPQAAKANDQRLQQFQKELGDLYEQARRSTLAAALQGSPTQTLGSQACNQARKACEGLSKGDAKALRQALDDLKSELAKSSGAADPQAKLQDLQQRLEAQRMQVAASACQNPALTQALTTAAQALAQAAADGTPSSEALAAAGEALDLAGLEGEALAQSLRDLQSLRQALDAARLARCANGMKPLDGSQCGACGDLEDYATLYQALLAQGQGACQGQGAGQEPGQGLGMGGPGQGQGGKAPENEAEKTAFNPDLARSRLQAGRMLMSWKTQEQAPIGEAARDLRAAVDTVRSSLSEAITSERIPAGYHQAIQRYFDDLGRQAQPPAPATQAGEPP